MNSAGWWKQISVISSFVLLCGCGGTPSNSNLSPRETVKTAASKSPLQSFDFAQAVHDFKEADPKSIIEPYLELVGNMLNTDSREYCGADFNQKVERMLELNKSSIWAYAALATCADLTGDSEAAKLSRDNIAQISSILLDGKSGASVGSAFPIRELSEARLIIDAAGLEVLDAESVHINKNLYFKLHCYDKQTNTFTYRYVQNFEFFTPYLEKSLNIGNLDEAGASSIFSRLYAEQDNDEIHIEMMRSALLRFDYKRVEEDSIKRDQLTPVAEVLLAQAYLNQRDDIKLDLLLDSVLASSEKGVIEAKAFVATFMFIKGSSNENTPDIKKLIQEIDDMTHNTHGGAVAVLQLLSSRTDYAEQLTRFLKQFPETNYLDAVYDYYKQIKAQQRGRRYFDRAIRDTLFVLNDLGYTNAAEETNLVAEVGR